MSYIRDVDIVEFRVVAEFLATLINVEMIDVMEVLGEVRYTLDEDNKKRLRCRA